jgi:hypothetical protein
LQQLLKDQARSKERFTGLDRANQCAHLRCRWQSAPPKR